MDLQFQNYCRKWSQDVVQIDQQSERIDYFQKQLPRLLLDHNTVRSILKRMARGRNWPDLRQSGLFHHEILLYLDSSRRFSVRLYFHLPHSPTMIHDHTSWGISGTPFGRLLVISYACENSDQKDHVTLQCKNEKTLLPGDVEVTQPWSEGIHQTGSADDSLNVMLSIYGPPGRRLYVNCYDQETGKVERRYPPRMLRRMLAEEMLVATATAADQGADA